MEKLIFKKSIVIYPYNLESITLNNEKVSNILLRKKNGYIFY